MGQEARRQVKRHSRWEEQNTQMPRAGEVKMGRKVLWSRGDCPKHHAKEL